jgi:phospholipid transport system substrate-binding protein
LQAREKRDQHETLSEVTAVAGKQHIWLRLSKRLSVAVVAVLLACGPAGADEASPRGVVERLHATLLEVMRTAGELGYSGRYQRLEPVVRQSYDLPFMLRIAVGPTWEELSESDRARLLDLFTEMSVANYAANFKGYSGESFEITGERPGPRDAVVIESKLNRPSDKPVGLDYVLKQSEDGWRIIDVLLDAKFSELAKQRSEFAAVLKDGGVPDLMATLERKVKELAGPG